MCIGAPASHLFVLGAIGGPPVFHPLPRVADRIPQPKRVLWREGVHGRGVGETVLCRVERRKRALGAGAEEGRGGAGGGVLNWCWPYH